MRTTTMQYKAHEWRIFRLFLVAILLVVMSLNAVTSAMAQTDGFDDPVADEITSEDTGADSSSELPPELAGILANYNLTPPEVKYVPDVPYFAPGDIIEVANQALDEFGPKRSVYPRIINGGTYSNDSGRKEFVQGMMKAFKVLYGITDRWSVFSYAGTPSENGAWFYPLTVTSNDPTLLSTGHTPQVIHDENGRQQISVPSAKLDAMMAVNIAMVENVGVRDLPMNPGVLSFTLVDGKTEGSFAVAFALDSQFAKNYTAGNKDLVPAVILNGMPAAPVTVSYYDDTGELVESIDARIEATNGTLSVEVPVGGAFVVLSVPVRGDSDNANTEVLIRMGSQPLSDTPGKNWVPVPFAG